MLESRKEGAGGGADGNEGINHLSEGSGMWTSLRRQLLPFHLRLPLSPGPVRPQTMFLAV